ncbi:hypothetical protein Ciccas_004351 [Cichlidogyrus casuarinus]|uniref:Uncharacterized protein n=1 Tax=Cichlidogyrus casuarinus TaxID=1844966 RepID=A0ABD2QBU2_9PLAT
MLALLTVNAIHTQQPIDVNFTFAVFVTAFALYDYPSRPMQLQQLIDHNNFSSNETVFNTTKILYHTTKLTAAIQRSHDALQAIAADLHNFIKKCDPTLYRALYAEGAAIVDENQNVIEVDFPVAKITALIKDSFLGHLRFHIVLFLWDQLVVHGFTNHIFIKTLLTLIYIFLPRLVEDHPSRVFEQLTHEIYTKDFINAWRLVPEPPLDEASAKVLHSLHLQNRLLLPQVSTEPSPVQVEEEATLPIRAIGVKNLGMVLTTLMCSEFERMPMRIEATYYVNEVAIHHFSIPSTDIISLGYGVLNDYQTDEHFQLNELAYGFEITTQDEIVLPATQIAEKQVTNKNSIQVFLFLRLYADCPLASGDTEDEASEESANEEENEALAPSLATFNIGWTCIQCVEVRYNKRNEIRLMPKREQRTANLIPSQPDVTKPVTDLYRIVIDAYQSRQINECYAHIRSAKLLKRHFGMFPIITEKSHLCFQLFSVRAKKPPKDVPFPFRVIGEEFKQLGQPFQVGNRIKEAEDEQERRVIEELNRVTTPMQWDLFREMSVPFADNSYWVPFKRPHSSELALELSTTSDTICIYVDQLRFMPDIGTIYKVTGRILNSGIDEWLDDIELLPDLNLQPLNRSKSRARVSNKETCFDYIRSPTFNAGKRIILNWYKDKILTPSSVLLLRVYTLTKDTLELRVLGNCFIDLFTKHGHLKQGGHQKRLYSTLPISMPFESISESSLDDAPFLSACSILVRLLPYTQEPIPAPSYSSCCYQSAGSELTDFEKDLITTYKQKPGSDNYRRIMKDIAIRKLSHKKWISKRVPPIILQPRELRLAYRIEYGIRIRLQFCGPLILGKDEYPFVVVRFLRGSQTRLASVNSYYRYGTDDNLLFLEPASPLQALDKPLWRHYWQGIKPYYDPNGALMIQVFSVPLDWVQDKLIICEKGYGLFHPLDAALRKRQYRNSYSQKLSKRHLVSWSLMKPFADGFVRDGIHDLSMFHSDYNSSFVKRFQERGEAVLFTRKAKYHAQSLLRIQLENDRFVEELGSHNRQTVPEWQGERHEIPRPNNLDQIVEDFETVVTESQGRNLRSYIRKLVSRASNKWPPPQLDQENQAEDWKPLEDAFLTQLRDILTIQIVGFIF